MTNRVKLKILRRPVWSGYAGIVTVKKIITQLVQISALVKKDYQKIKKKNRKEECRKLSTHKTNKH